MTITDIVEILVKEGYEGKEFEVSDWWFKKLIEELNVVVGDTTIKIDERSHYITYAGIVLASGEVNDPAIDSAIYNIISKVKKEIPKKPKKEPVKKGKK